MLKATIVAAGAATAIFSALLAAPAQAAPLTNHGGHSASRGCENEEGGGLLGINLLTFQQNNCDDFYGGGYGGGGWYGGGYGRGGGYGDGWYGRHNRHHRFFDDDCDCRLRFEHY
ncbi:hypothetical protein AB0L06_19035 [Spirillospora sp. NPDC052269]